MENAKKDKIFKSLQNLATHFIKEVPQASLESHTDTLASFPIEDLQIAFKRAKIECDWYPMPSKLIAMMKVSPKADAIELVHRIWEHCRLTGSVEWETAKLDLGEEVWERVVGGYFGYTELCKSGENERVGKTAQLRDQAVAFIEQRILNNVKNKNKLIKSENPNILGT